MTLRELLTELGPGLRRGPLAWRAVAELASRQHGVAALWQLERLGLSARAISRAVAAGRLHRLHRGVYAVGHQALSRDAVMLAAALAGRPGTYVARLSSANAHGLHHGPLRPVELSSPVDRLVRQPGLRLHRTSALTPADVTQVRGVPVTSVPRVLLDMAAMGRIAELHEAIGRAQRRRILDVRAVAELIGRCAGHRGVAILRRETEELLPHGGVSRTDYETRVRALFENHGIEPPVVNGLIRLEFETLQVDFHWPAARLVVEADSYEWHHDLEAFNEDRRRDQELKREGWEVLRFTWRQLTREPARVARIVAEVLESRLAAQRHAA